MHAAGRKRNAHLAGGGAMQVLLRLQGSTPREKGGTDTALNSLNTRSSVSCISYYYVILTMVLVSPPLQAKLFPQYFWLQTGGALIALATLHYSGTGILRPQLITLGAPLLPLASTTRRINARNPAHDLPRQRAAL